MKILKDSTYHSLLSKLSVLETELAKKEIKIYDTPTIITPGASSTKDIETGFLHSLTSGLDVLSPEFDFEVIPVIRKLVKVNPDVNQAYNDLVRLANTGHKVIFDPSVGADQVDKMRKFILNSSKTWHVGAPSINGIVNKMFRQIMISGAIATEWVPNLALNNLEQICFLFPERVRFMADKNNAKYQPYQKIKHRFLTTNNKEYKKLNINQFRYSALNGDTDLPYGIPPYLAALGSIDTQARMIENINFIVKAMGVLGWIDAKIAKPARTAGESDEAYLGRLNQFLDQFKERLKSGTRDGITTGFMGDHEYDFKQTAKTAQGAKDLFEQNELLIASGLNYDAAFMGRPGSTETLVTILFTKMIAQLKNIQDLVADNLEHGYSLALALGGFQFKELHIQFNRSTITDDLKYQQGQEIKIRNLQALYDQGIIGQDGFADDMGYIKADQAEPRVSRDPSLGQEVVAKQTREKKKDANDKKNRDKNKPQGTTRGPRSAKASATTPRGLFFEIGKPLSQAS